MNHYSDEFKNQVLKKDVSLSTRRTIATPLPIEAENGGQDTPETSFSLT
jgi:hypothetical protein